MDDIADGMLARRAAAVVAAVSAVAAVAAVAAAGSATGERELGRDGRPAARARWRRARKERAKERKRKKKEREGFTAAGIRRPVIMLRPASARGALTNARRFSAASSPRLRNASLHDASLAFSRDVRL